MQRAQYFPQTRAATLIKHIVHHRGITSNRDTRGEEIDATLRLVKGYSLAGAPEIVCYVFHVLSSHSSALLAQFTAMRSLIVARKETMDGHITDLEDIDILTNGDLGRRIGDWANLVRVTKRDDVSYPGWLNARFT